ncbi:MAG: transcriptional regulator NrdR [Oscillospiraceae bacterium]|nr:transcriptional regulator NrdR [Oscillospiraceae bacterium]
MKCPFCGHWESRVIDSRPTDEWRCIRRRRECLECQRRFTTYETVETLPVTVIKKDGTRQSFDRDKLVAGLMKACANRPVSRESINTVAQEIENAVHGSLDREVRSYTIAQLAMGKLKELDEVAYVRFASVTNRFSDVESFFELLDDLKNNKG